MKRIGSLLLLPVVLALSCGSRPQPEEQVSPPPVEQPAAQVQSAPPPEPPPPPEAPKTPEAPPAPVVQAVVPAPVEPAPAPVEPPPPPVQVVQPAAPVQSAPPPKEVFDPGNITEEMYETTKADVQSLIADLNRIIRARNYNAWVGHLSASYLKEISSQPFLENITEELYKRDQIVATNLGRDPRRVQKKILRTAKDYFDNVVVPSRSNDRMDDIDFVSENRVKAYTLDTRGQRLILYDLELIDEKWKIIN